MMPGGYIPAPSTQPAQLLTVSSRKARLEAGGSFYRTRTTGRAGNKITVQCIDGAFVVTNYNLAFSENVTGPATVVALDLRMKSNEQVVIDQLHTPTPRARKYSISFKIAPDAPIIEDLGVFTFSRLFSIPDLLSVKLTPAQQVFTETDQIIIAPRTRVYHPASIPLAGLDITELRGLVNAADPWIVMPERGTDELDTGMDDAGMQAFAETYLEGGDGLPSTPAGLNTGPIKTLVHVNYGERPDGRLGEVNQVYEWVGDGPVNGAWKPYSPANQ